MANDDQGRLRNTVLIDAALARPPAAQAPGHVADPQRLRPENHLPQRQAPRREGDSQALFKLLHAVRGLPRVVIPAQRDDIRAVGVAEVHQVVVEPEPGTADPELLKAAAVLASSLNG